MEIKKGTAICYSIRVEKVDDSNEELVKDILTWPEICPEWAFAGDTSIANFIEDHATDTGSVFDYEDEFNARLDWPKGSYSFVSYDNGIGGKVAVVRNVTHEYDDKFKPCESYVDMLFTIETSCS